MPCPTQAGRYIYGMTEPAEYIRMIQENTMSMASAAKLKEAELIDKIITGVIHESNSKPEFVEELNLLRRAE